MSVGWSKEGFGVLSQFGGFVPGRGAASRERRRPQCSAAATGPAPAADRADGPGGRPAAAPADRPRGRPAVPARPLRLRSVLRRPSAPPDAPRFIFRKSGVESRATHSRQSSVHCVEIQSSCEKYCTWSQPKHGLYHLQALSHAPSSVTQCFLLIYDAIGGMASHVCPWKAGIFNKCCTNGAQVGTISLIFAEI